tara:strand:- start:87 stop:731 length:645 start_codon:yes stop_codon:yes gene_type:complete
LKKILEIKRNNFSFNNLKITYIKVFNFYKLRFNMRITLYFFILISCKSEDNVLEPETPLDEKVEIYLIDELNEKRGYCLDMMGYKLNADINKSLQAHSCYSYQGEIAVDQGFDKLKISNNQFYLPYFNVCLEAKTLENSSNLILQSCDRNEKQRFILKDNGQITLESNNNLCITISETFREGGGGNPVHLIREISLEQCNNNQSHLQSWGIRGI